VTVAPISSALLQPGCIPDDSIIAAGDPDDVNPIADPEIIPDSDGGESKVTHHKFMKYPVH